MEFSVMHGELVTESADVLVFAARTDLEMEGSVARRLREEAGQEIAEDAFVKGPVKLGQVVATDAYGLDSEYVMHAAAIPGHNHGNPSTASIRGATRTALRRSDELGCQSVALPVVGADMATVAFKEAAQIVCETIWEFEPSSLEDVRVVVDGDMQYEYATRIADAVQST